MNPENKKTLVMGASPEPSRYSFLATKLLQSFGHDVVAFGKRKGKINDIEIMNDFPEDDSFDTVTLYLNPSHQQEYYDRILRLNPKRVIFNPGTENEEFYDLLKQNNILAEEACTLVLLKTGSY